MITGVETVIRVDHHDRLIMQNLFIWITSSHEPFSSLVPQTPGLHLFREL